MIFLLQGYKQKKAYIIAQGPLENTCRDFWKMIYERDCCAIVMLSGVAEGGQVSGWGSKLAVSVKVADMILVSSVSCNSLSFPLSGGVSPLLAGIWYGAVWGVYCVLDAGDEARWFCGEDF